MKLTYNREETHALLWAIRESTDFREISRVDYIRNAISRMETHPFDIVPGYVTSAIQYLDEYVEAYAKIVPGSMETFERLTPIARRLACYLSGLMAMVTPDR